ncbi:PREDICTED: phospholipase B1, membrane-associated-like [Amphimedon queenslandica]|uniref:Uncharacterized protein n=1 Tax=Amphimedon queenslandica TaxID=400682 RepID=A0AAN0JQ19_AMPQE|nr:PREDICTED: phospholipase B1, membrane-associated-like [Amphimedon queenslandica]|eukprot:XP_019859140.1 PREDICTED: phospholipase B1, membrane-associated-like [Amphimedon queenslandica]
MMKKLLFSFLLFLYSSGVPVFCSDFNCTSLPPLSRQAGTVHELRPQDIKVVMAFGDSITAGFSMKGIHGLDTIYEYRGLSWSIGGDPNATTIPGFLKTYTPDLIGASLKSHILEFCYGDACIPDQHRPSEDVFNAAQTGAMLSNVNKEEYKYLYEQVSKNSKIDMKNDWKLLTILAGFNDLCLGCSGKVPILTPDDFESLEKVRANIPRVFVNVVEIFNLSLVYEKTKDSDYCLTFHRLFAIECFCLFDPDDGAKWRQIVDDHVVQYNERIRKVADDYKQKNYTEFAVIAQPGLRDGTAANVPFDFFSTFDCFHPSVKGHEAFAKVVWNNMLTPAAKKSTTFDHEAPYICPTSDTLLYTY